jgi:hypothetical protein
VLIQQPDRKQKVQKDQQINTIKQDGQEENKEQQKNIAQIYVHLESPPIQHSME